MRIPAIALLLGASLLAGPAAAQDDMSVDEIRDAFQKQLSAFKTVKTRGLGGGGQDRGLKLITVDDIRTDARGDQVIAEPSDAGPAASATTQTASTTPAEPTTTTTQPATATTTTGATVTATATPDTTTTGSDTATVTTASSSASDPFKPLVYGQFKPEMQVNLHIEFGFDSAALDSSQRPKLEKMCIVLQTTPINKIRIVGHTDSAGTAEYNERLSVLRAREVARHLTEDCGIDPARLETVGLGERFPTNETDPAADENRRVEFQALS